MSARTKAVIHKLESRMRRQRFPLTLLWTEIEMLLQSGLPDDLVIATEVMEHFVARPGAPTEYRFSPSDVATQHRFEGLIAQRRGLWANAAEAFAAAVEAEPDEVADAVYLLGSVVTEHSLVRYYARALELLNAESKRGMQVLPVEHFQTHLLSARLLGRLGQHQAARQHALRALDYAQVRDNGLAKHKHEGLVAFDPGVLGELRAMLDERARH